MFLNALFSGTEEVNCALGEWISKRTCWSEANYLILALVAPEEATKGCVSNREGIVWNKGAAFIETNAFINKFCSPLVVCFN